MGWPSFEEQLAFWELIYWPMAHLKRWRFYAVKLYSENHRECFIPALLHRRRSYKGGRFGDFDCISSHVDITLFTTSMAKIEVRPNIAVYIFYSMVRHLVGPGFSLLAMYS